MQTRISIKALALVVAAAAAGGLAVFAATGFGGDGKTDLADRIDKRFPPTERVKVHEVKTAPAGAGAVAAARRVRVKYFVGSNRSVDPGGADDVTVGCPSGKTLGGFLDSLDPGLALSHSENGSGRTWHTGVISLAGSPITWAPGIVCATGVR